LPDPAVNPHPLSCEEDNEDALLAKRSELRTAQKSGRYRERDVAEFTPISTLVVDVEQIPYPTDSFDVVIANHMLYHVPDRNRAFAEIARVSRGRSL
jgi:ubiquinone/menaquinone biosynthesis C-methylase UbiE